MRVGQSSPLSMLGRGSWSAEAEAVSPGVGELVGSEPVAPVALVVLGREVAGTGAGEERLAHGGGVGLVAWAPGGGGDVHDVAPALLVLHRGDRMDHVA